LLVTVNNKLILEIEIVHDLSCHPIVAVTASSVGLYSSISLHVLTTHHSF